MEQPLCGQGTGSHHQHWVWRQTQHAGPWGRCERSGGAWMWVWQAWRAEPRMSQTKNMLSGTLAGVGDSFATPWGPHTLGEVSSISSWAPCPPPRDPRHPRSRTGAVAGRWARSPWGFSEASSEAAVSPGRKKQGRDSLGQDTRGQSACLLQRPTHPSLLRKLAEVAFIAAEVRPTHRHPSLRASPQPRRWLRPHGAGGEKGTV